MCDDRLRPSAVQSNKQFVFGSLLSRDTTSRLLNEVRNSYLTLNKEKQTDLSEDDLLIDTVKPVPHTPAQNDKCVSSDNATITDQIHVDDQIEHHKSDSTSLRRQRRSSSLKSTVKETTEHDLSSTNRKPTTKLLNHSEKFDLNYVLLKLASFKSILSTDLRG